MHGKTPLGTLTEYEVDQPWFRCYFTPLPAYDEFRPLFEAERNTLFDVELTTEQKLTESEAITAQIDLLKLHLISDRGMHIQPILLHIDGEKAQFRY